MSACDHEIDVSHYKVWIVNK
jgi:hypothetical protein